MNRSVIQAAILSLGLLAAVSCNQSPVFSKISNETKPIPPLIPGSPTNMVVVERTYGEPESAVTVPVLFVASGRLHWYAKEKEKETEDEEVKSKWDLKKYPIKQPGGKVMSLAVDKNNRLYALCINGDGVDATLEYIESNENEWKTVSFSEKGYIQSIYVDPETDRLFAGVRETTNYYIYYLEPRNESPELKPALKEKLELEEGLNSILSGAVYRDGIHYLCTTGKGIYQVNEADILTDGSSASAVQLEESDVIHPANADKKSSPEKNRTFMGMIKLKDTAQTIIAIERTGGALYKVNPGSFEQIPCGDINNDKGWIKTDKYATGALALWEDTNNKVLIAGIQGGLTSSSTSTSSSSSYTHGYVEFALNDDGSLDTSESRRDVGRMESVDDTDQYTTSLGKHPINHLFQSPKEINEKMIFFASTQTAGLWSYKARKDSNDKDKIQWNAEAEN